MVGGCASIRRESSSEDLSPSRGGTGRSTGNVDRDCDPCTRLAARKSDQPTLTEKLVPAPQVRRLVEEPNDDTGLESLVVARITVSEGALRRCPPRAAIPFHGCELSLTNKRNS